MRFDWKPGALDEPLTGRRWEPPEILERVSARAAFYRARGLGPRDRVFLHFGNNLEFFVELLAIWSRVRFILSTSKCTLPLGCFRRVTAFEWRFQTRFGRWFFRRPTR